MLLVRAWSATPSPLMLSRHPMGNTMKVQLWVLAMAAIKNLDAKDHVDGTAGKHFDCIVQTHPSARGSGR